jgi:hypothetical protein
MQELFEMVGEALGESVLGLICELLPEFVSGCVEFRSHVLLAEPLGLSSAQSAPEAYRSEE